MKRSINFLSMIIAAMLFTTACQEQSENPNQFSEEIVVDVENEANAESAFEDVDDISYESMFYYDDDARIAVSEESPIFCAERTHNKEAKTITLDFGDGCEDMFGRVRSGKMIVSYTDRIYEPGSVITTTFEDFYCDGKKVEGTRIRTNISESSNDFLRFRIELIDGRVTWEDNTFATREANWEVTRIRTSNPINDERVRTGSASGMRRNGNVYTVTITKAIVWKRGCLPLQRIMIPVEGTKVIELENGSTITIDYGNGTCDNLVTITKDGVTVTKEFKYLRLV